MAARDCWVVLAPLVVVGLVMMKRKGGLFETNNEEESAPCNKTFEDMEMEGSFGN